MMKWKHRKEIKEKFFEYDRNEYNFNRLKSYFDTLEIANMVFWEIGACLYFYYKSHYRVEPENERGFCYFRGAALIFRILDDDSSNLCFYYNRYKR